MAPPQSSHGAASGNRGLSVPVEAYEAAMRKLSSLPLGRAVTDDDYRLGQRVFEDLGLQPLAVTAGGPSDELYRGELEKAVADLNRAVNGRAHLIVESATSLAKGYHISLATPARIGGESVPAVCSAATPLSATGCGQGGPNGRRGGGPNQKTTMMGDGTGGLNTNGGNMVPFRTPPEFHGLAMDSSVLSPIHATDEIPVSIH
jgi:hypothetical protein